MSNHLAVEDDDDRRPVILPVEITDDAGRTIWRGVSLPDPEELQRVLFAAGADQGRIMLCVRTPRRPPALVNLVGPFVIDQDIIDWLNISTTG